MKINKQMYQVCTNCVMDTTDEKIVFDADGKCDYCNGYYNDILPNWNKIHQNSDALKKVITEIKKNSGGQKYDCIIGMSGGVDSSYLCYVTKEIMGLNPLLYTVDTGWNLNVANDNINKIVTALKLDIYTEKVNWDECKDLQVSFLKSQVPYQDFVQDHAIFAGLYNFAVKNRIKYVLTGANNATECVRPPVEWVYVNDVRLMNDIHKKFGSVKLKTFPTCGMFKYRLYYAYIKGMKRVAPLDYIEYDKQKVEAFLNKEFGWEPYANKHYEDIFTRWYEGYYLIEKFGYDKRKCYFSNLILTGQMTREEALEELSKKPYSQDLVQSDTAYIAGRLDLTVKELNEIISGENKTYRDYKNSFGAISFAMKIAKIVGVEKRNFR